MGAKRLEIVQILIKAGSDVNHEAPTCGTPLHDASYNGLYEIVQELLKAGADVNWQPSKVSSHDKGTALHSAASGGNAEIVKLLLEHGADVNAIDKVREKDTPIHSALNPAPESNQRKQVVQLLLEHGADVNQKDKGGHTPLFWAQKFGKNLGPDAEDIIKLLIQHGAKSE
jgi:serine/threonine-protein phosphatase 6 regulatory ankyrin repeat subunit B